MKITKFGHACFLIEEGNARILLDPGSFSTVPKLPDLSAVLVTHEHFDHLDVEVIRRLRLENEAVQIITHAGVGTKLIEAGIAYTEIQDGEEIDVAGVTVRSFGVDHAPIYGPVPCQNTGFMVADRFFYPGDAFVVPPTRVEILALPTGAPWMKLAEAIDYAKQVDPKVIIPAHDALYIAEFREGPIQRTITANVAIPYRQMSEGSVEEF